MTFNESNLSFSFDKNWQVFSFDQHRFYHHLKSAGLKGVDFIGIYNNEFLLLMEVKNYNWRKASPVAPDISSITGENAGLINDFTKKLEDSILAIETVHKYYKRKFWYKSVTAFWRYLPYHWTIKFESYFWSRCFELLNQFKSAHFVLWLETEDSYPGLSKDEIALLKVKIQKNAKQKLSDWSPEIVIAGEGVNPYGHSLIVKKQKQKN